MTLTDTEDTIRMTTPEEDRRYKAWGKELQADARALLATVRHLMTGREIDTCEAAEDIENSKVVDVFIIESLRNTFYAQICNFKDRA
jgi:hypothetical protein